MKITKSKLRQIIKEELEAISDEPSDLEKWATITMGRRLEYPEWEMLSNEVWPDRLKNVLRKPDPRRAFDEAYEAIKDLPREAEFKLGKPIALEFFEILRLHELEATRAQLRHVGAGRGVAIVKKAKQLLAYYRRYSDYLDDGDFAALRTLKSKTTEDTEEMKVLQDMIGKVISGL